jgi:hypothetical protein
VERVEQRLGVGEGLDAQRRGRGDEDPLDLVGLRERRAGAGIVRAGVERRGGLARDLDLPAGAAPPQPRRLGARGEQAEQRLGPEVLVDVGRRHAGMRVHYLLDQLG